MMRIWYTQGPGAQIVKRGVDFLSLPDRFRRLPQRGARRTVGHRGLYSGASRRGRRAGSRTEHDAVR